MVGGEGEQPWGSGRGAIAGVTDRCPPWPPEPELKNENVNETEVKLVSCRVVFCKEFIHQIQWKNSLQMKCIPAGVHFRSYGWNHNPTPEEESIIGYFKVQAKHADQVLSQSGRQSAFFQIMQTDVDKENTKTKIRWLERGEQNAVRTPGFGLWSGLQRPQTKVGGAWSPICLEP